MKFVPSIPICSRESVSFVCGVPCFFFDFEDEIFLRWLRCNDSYFYIILKSNISNICVNDLPRLFYRPTLVIVV